MNETKRIFFAALSALRNMGISLPDNRDLRDVRESIYCGEMNLKDAVDRLCSGYYTCEDDQKAFQDEAQMWYEENLPWKKTLPKHRRAWRNSFPARWGVALKLDEKVRYTSSIVTALAAALSEIQQEPGMNFNSDPAVRIMVHLLACVTGVGTTITALEYIDLKDRCRMMADAVIKLRDEE